MNPRPHLAPDQPAAHSTALIMSQLSHDVVDTQKEKRIEKLFDQLRFAIFTSKLTGVSLHDAMLSLYSTDEITELLNANSKTLCRPFDNTILITSIVLEESDENCQLAEAIISALHDYIDPNKFDSEGKTALILAAKMRNTRLVRILLENEFSSRININAQDRMGRTALHYACAMGDIEMARALVDAGANPDLRDDCDKTPYDMTYASSEELTGLFESVALDPCRDKTATHNKIGVNDHIKFKTTTKENVEIMLADADKAVRECLVPEEALIALKNELSRLSGQSLLQSSLSGQGEVRRLLSRTRDLSIRSADFTGSISDALQPVIPDELEVSSISVRPD
ncbi:hypothetical protein AQUSIP_11290 [Aquicella siphonis]|uniref:Uncharacterized protein n=1 Tax=Aquicella siphonis TaxID=254247 RepID=A0A5E4PHA8_9COXI|nr:ankyrin repeat domain-containing protein [Aquicella siphonis]VVC75832.1 hypothetical protein AQUSIP_11290 [Aquicella siphonis]